MKYNKNKVSLTVNGKKDKTLLLPISYDNGYSATVNGKKVELEKVYDNFIGIPLQEGENNINLKYIPNGFMSTLIISIIAFIVTVLLIKFDLFNKIINIDIVGNIAYYIYLTLYLAMVVCIYILLTLCFLVSYFVYLRV